MGPLIGNRWIAVTAEKIAWLALTVGMLALLLLVLLVSVQSLGEPGAVESGAPEGVTAPRARLNRPAPELVPRDESRSSSRFEPDQDVGARAGWCRPGPCASV